MSHKGAASLTPENTERLQPLLDAFRIIDEGLLKSKELVHIVDGVLDQSWQGNAAPIYQFLIAIAEDVGTINFHAKRVVTLKRATKKAKNANPPEEDKVVICTAKLVGAAGRKRLIAGEPQKTFRAATTKVVIRHGAKSRLYRMTDMIEPGLVKKMELAHDEQKDFNYLPAWPEHYYDAPDGFVCGVNEPGPYVEHHLDYVREVLKIVGSTAEIQTRSESRASLEDEVDEEDDWVERAREPEKLLIEVINPGDSYVPQKCFGIKLAPIDQPEMYDE